MKHVINDQTESVSVPLSDLGEFLVRLRQQKGILQKDLAQRIGVLPPALNRMERERYRSVSFERLVKVAEALDVSLVVSIEQPKDDSAVSKEPQQLS